MMITDTFKIFGYEQYIKSYKLLEMAKIMEKNKSASMTTKVYSFERGERALYNDIMVSSKNWRQECVREHSISREFKKLKQQGILKW